MNKYIVRIAASYIDTLKKYGNITFRMEILHLDQK